MQQKERPVQDVMAEFDVPARMRDGVTLRANVYRPNGEGPWPTLLARTPYDKGGCPTLTWLDPVQTAAKGFMVVVQDTRGRFASEGQWIPLHFEREDGYDTVEWAARLPGSNGRVGMFGYSYIGHVQWMAAAEQPPSLAAIAPGLISTDFLNGLFSRGGAIELGLAALSTLQTGAAHLERLELPEQELGERFTALVDDYDKLTSNGLWGLPVQDLPVLRRHHVPELGTLRRFNDPDVVKRCDITGEYERVIVPSFQIAAWHDVCAQGVLDSYTAMAALGRPARLVVGPWTHFEFIDPIGDLRFGLRASRVGVPVHTHGDLNDEQLAWFAHYLTSEFGSADIEQPPVRIFVMGRNEWRDEASWPPTRARGTGGSSALTARCDQMVRSRATGRRGSSTTQPIPCPRSAAIRVWNRHSGPGHGIRDRSRRGLTCVYSPPSRCNAIWR